MKWSYFLLPFEKSNGRTNKFPTSVNASVRVHECNAIVVANILFLPRQRKRQRKTAKLG
jgi:hypothetical protein